MPFDAQVAAKAGSTDPDEVLRWQCMNGQCGVFAAILSALTGWTMVSLIVTSPSGRSAGIHAMVQPPDRRALIDATGYHESGVDYLAEFLGDRYDGYRFRLVPLAEAGHGYANGWPGLMTATVPEIASLVFRILTDIGYQIPPERAGLSRDDLATALAVAVAGCPTPDQLRITPTVATSPE